MFTLSDLQAKRVAIQRRIRANITMGHDGCWLWRGARSKKGYAQMRVDGVKHGVHRVSYEAFVGPIPAGLEIDHVCKTRYCVNPEHLEPVTHEENIRRSDAGKPQRDRTHCKQGHEYSKENTIWSGKPGKRRRHCRICVRAAGRRFHHAHADDRAEYMRDYYKTRKEKAS